LTKRHVFIYFSKIIESFAKSQWDLFFKTGYIEEASNPFSFTIPDGWQKISTLPTKLVRYCVHFKKSASTASSWSKTSLALSHEAKKNDKNINNNRTKKNECLLPPSHIHRAILVKSHFTFQFLTRQLPPERQILDVKMSRKSWLSQMIGHDSIKAKPHQLYYKIPHCEEKQNTPFWRERWWDRLTKCIIKIKMHADKTEKVWFETVALLHY